MKTSTLVLYISGIILGISIGHTFWPKTVECWGCLTDAQIKQWEDTADKISCLDKSPRPILLTPSEVKKENYANDIVKDMQTRQDELDNYLCNKGFDCERNSIKLLTPSEMDKIPLPITDPIRNWCLPPSGKCGQYMTKSQAEQYLNSLPLPTSSKLSI